jgi:hypothetical protein
MFMSVATTAEPLHIPSMALMPDFDQLNLSLGFTGQSVIWKEPAMRG